MAVNDSMLNSGGGLADLPTFDLNYTVDDGDDPEWITVYAEDAEEFATHWITVDVEHAVDIVDVA
jgi:hypothetical protein